jgi:hypothetical protein
MYRSKNYRSRNSLSYKMKFWFWSDHTKEIKAIIRFIGEFFLTLLWFGAIVFLPHFFH